jgi:hypothetical protein
MAPGSALGYWDSGSGVGTSTRRHRSWTGTSQTVDADNYFNAISCSAARVCEAVGSADDFVYLNDPK